MHYIRLEDSWFMLKALSLLNEEMTYCDINFLESVWVDVSINKCNRNLELLLSTVVIDKSLTLAYPKLSQEKSQASLDEYCKKTLKISLERGNDIH